MSGTDIAYGSVVVRIRCAVSGGARVSVAAHVRSRLPSISHAPPVVLRCCAMPELSHVHVMCGNLAATSVQVKSVSAFAIYGTDAAYTAIICLLACFVVPATGRMYHGAVISFSCLLRDVLIIYRMLLVLRDSHADIAYAAISYTVPSTEDGTISPSTEMACAAIRSS
eukprot:3933575-Rhodomonas_salina.7